MFVLTAGGEAVISAGDGSIGTARTPPAPLPLPLLLLLLLLLLRNPSDARVVNTVSHVGRVYDEYGGAVIFLTPATAGVNVGTNCRLDWSITTDITGRCIAIVRKQRGS